VLLPAHIVERIRAIVATTEPVGGGHIDNEAAKYGGIALMGTIGTILLEAPTNGLVCPTCDGRGWLPERWTPSSGPKPRPRKGGVLLWVWLLLYLNPWTQSTLRRRLLLCFSDGVRGETRNL
jgi:hypothetical protein